MAKVSHEQAAANRKTLVTAAGSLLRQKGMDGVGVAELCKAAGMTHGALYSHFASKEELLTEAFAEGQSASRARMQAAIGKEPELGAILDFYVSKRHRDDMANCCPMLASASEAARQSASLRKGFARAFEDLVEMVGQAAGDGGDERANFIAASMIGVVAVARALRVPDPSRSEKLIKAARQALAALTPDPLEPAPRANAKTKPR